MCENMEDQSESKVEGDEGEEMMGNNEISMSMEASNLIGEMAEEENQKKRRRHRRRRVYESIRNQMEFYFGDANLAKDRFLSKLTEENPEVDLAIFLQFNKIRSLTDNIRHIKKALKHSELLSVSEDGTKVFRTKPVQIKENVDDCTIYVEKLPLEADHEWLTKIFSRYGTVDYVSIPKYRSTEKIKGFAFVEFHTPEEAQKALEVFGAAGCCLSSNIEPEKLCSIVTHEEISENQQQRSNDNIASYGQESASVSTGEQERLHEEGGIEEVTLEDQDGEDENSKKSKKRESNKLPKSTDTESIKKDEKKGKRKRKHTENSDKIGDKEEDPSDKDETKSKKKRKHVESITVQEEDVHSKNEEKKKQKLVEVGNSSAGQEASSGKDERKRKRKHSEIAIKSDEEDDNLSGNGEKDKEIDVSGLEKSSSEFEKSNKRKLQVEAAVEDEGNVIPGKKARMESDVEKEQENTDTDNCAVEDDHHKTKKTRHRKKKKRIVQEVGSLGLQVLSKNEWKRLRNKYLNLQKAAMKNLKQQLFRTRKWEARGSRTNGFSSQHSEQMNDVPSGGVSNTLTTTPRFSYTPGLIVRIGLDAPITNVNKFKAEAKSHGEVQYVDVREGATEAFVRCSTAEAAKQLVSSKPWEELAVLEGEDDKKYWERIQEDRHNMVNVQKKKKRGKDKLLARAEKALSKKIKFDETD